MKNKTRPDGNSDAGGDIPLERKLAFLHEASNYPEPVSRIEAIETHMSWVFLTDRHAYKLKKPVRYDLLDFTTLDARHFYCEEEVRLNRVLAPEVYLATIPLTRDRLGDLRLGGEGRPVDWLVKMHRLPDATMLDRRLADGTMEESDARRIVLRLAQFYARCPPAPTAADAYPERIEATLQNDQSVLCKDDYPLDAEEIRRIHVLQTTALRVVRVELCARASAGKLIEGHGDLRPEHVCVRESISIIDRLEFSQALRTLDTADEVAFLALECERLGASGFAARLLLENRVAMIDEPSPELIHFYQSCRAMTRAKLAIRHLDEEQFRLSEKWIGRAVEYLALAHRHALRACADAPT